MSVATNLVEVKGDISVKWEEKGDGRGRHEGEWGKYGGGRGRGQGGRERKWEEERRWTMNLQCALLLACHQSLATPGFARLDPTPVKHGC